MYPQYLFSDLAAHPGIIYLPYQVSMASLTEQYRMNIPMFFPSKDLLTKWHLEYQTVRQVSPNKERVRTGAVLLLPHVSKENETLKDLVTLHSSFYEMCFLWAPIETRAKTELLQTTST